MLKVNVEKCIRQILDGSHYKGYIKISETKLDYELVFVVPIPRLDDLEITNDIKDIRRLFQLSVARDNADINLTNDEYGFFIQLLIGLAVDFYNHPLTRSNNEGLIGKTLRGQGPLVEFGASMSIGTTNNGIYEFPRELCEMLNAPKFGCNLKA